MIRAFSCSGNRAFFVLKTGGMPVWLPVVLVELQ